MARMVPAQRQGRHKHYIELCNCYLEKKKNIYASSFRFREMSPSRQTIAGLSAVNSQPAVPVSLLPFHMVRMTSHQKKIDIHNTYIEIPRVYENPQKNENVKTY